MGSVGGYAEANGDLRERLSTAHLDLSASDADAEVNRLCALGVSVQAEREDWITMQDPDGNEFCIMRP